MELKGCRRELALRHACVIGVGAVTSIGVDAPMTAASVRAGITRFEESRFVDRAGEPMVIAIASFLSETLRGVERLTALAFRAMQEALAPLSGLRGGAALHAIPLIGGPTARPGWSGAAAPQLLANVMRAGGGLLSVRDAEMAPMGHAAAVAAVAKGADLIASGRAELVLAGGVDSYYDIETLEWLDETQRLHSERNRDGFVPGEGAGFCLLASPTTARQLGARVLARVRAVSVSTEPCPFTSDQVCTALGLTEAFHSVLAALPDGERADWTLCDMNGESFRASEWMYAYIRSGTKHRDPLEIWHPADCYGDVGAASGAVLMSLATAAWSRQYARGPRCLIWTSSDEGARGALLLEAA